MVWNNDWDDNESNGALERQQILRESADLDIEDEIRANLNAKITSSRHAYQVAGVALIVVLVSFTLNTVYLAISLLTFAGIRTVCTGWVTMAEAVLHAVSRSPKRADRQVHTPFIVVPDGPSSISVPTPDVALESVYRPTAPITSSFPQNNRCPHPFRISLRYASQPDTRQVHVLRHCNFDLYPDSCCKHLVLGGLSNIGVGCNSNVQLLSILRLCLFDSVIGGTFSKGQGLCRRIVDHRSVPNGLGYERGFRRHCRPSTVYW